MLAASTPGDRVDGCVIGGGGPAEAAYDDDAAVMDGHVVHGMPNGSPRCIFSINDMIHGHGLI